MLHGVGPGMDKDDNPFITEGPHTYLRFDAIRIETAPDTFGGVNVVYRWHSKDMLVQRQEGISFKHDASLELVGVTGRIGVTVHA